MATTTSGAAADAGKAEFLVIVPDKEGMLSKRVEIRQ
jgi:hypothetical protein